VDGAQTGGSTTARPRDWVGLGLLAVPCALISVNSNLLNLALPALAADLRPSTTQLLWISDIYGFLVAGLLLPMGLLADRFGRRRLLLVGAAVFGLASPPCTPSSSSVPRPRRSYRSWPAQPGSRCWPASSAGRLASPIPSSTWPCSGTAPTASRCWATRSPSAVPAARAGVAGATLETIANLGGALGIALLGSLAGTVYRTGTARTGTTTSTIGDALAQAAPLPPEQADDLVRVVREAFVLGFRLVAATGSALLVVSAIVTALLLRTPFAAR
jgi:MFS family permease